MQSIYDKLDEADGVVLGSPTYFYNMSSLTKAFIERLYCYDVFDEKDRSVWLSPGDLHGVKYACDRGGLRAEQGRGYGLYLSAMDRSLQAVGYRITDS
jgi:multimeric flavodoxin WrbA